MAEPVEAAVEVPTEIEPPIFAAVPVTLKGTYMCWIESEPWPWTLSGLKALVGYSHRDKVTGACAPILIVETFVEMLMAPVPIMLEVWGTAKLIV